MTKGYRVVVLGPEGKVVRTIEAPKGSAMGLARAIASLGLVDLSPGESRELEGVEAIQINEDAQDLLAQILNRTARNRESLIQICDPHREFEEQLEQTRAVLRKKYPRHYP